uniref:Uncharacterized protein n=1 Tax=Aegilops tauschii subsp. strangulata TaxID=200361 RepID=A0A453FGQ6_AEGTS
RRPRLETVASLKKKRLDGGGKWRAVSCRCSTAPSPLRLVPSSHPALPPSSRPQDPAPSPSPEQGFAPPVTCPSARSTGHCRRGGGPPGRGRRRLPGVSAYVELGCHHQRRHLRRGHAAAPLRPLRLRHRGRLRPRHPHLARIWGPGLPPRRRLLRGGHSSDQVKDKTKRSFGSG